MEQEHKEIVVLPEPANENERKQLTSCKPLDPKFVLEHRPCNMWRYNVYRLVKVHDNDYYVFCGRIVDMARVLKYTHETTPRYLFRAFSGKPCKEDGPSGFQSIAVAKGLGAQEMSVYSQEEMTELLKGHVEKSKKGYSHFISFKSSWIWTIHRAPRLRETLKHKQRKAQRRRIEGKKLKAQDVSAPGEHFAEVHIAIVDTFDLQCSTLFLNTFAMLRAHNLERNYLKDKSHGEILVWDELKGPFYVVPLDLLIHRQAGEPFGGELLLGLQPFLRRDPSRCDDHLRKSSDDRIKNTIYRKPFQIRGTSYNVQKRRDEYKDGLNMNGRLSTHRLDHRSTAMHQGAGNREWYAQDDRSPISPHQLSAFTAFVMTRFPPNLRFPMLVKLLSGRLRYLDEQSIIENMADSLADMMGSYVHYQSLASSEMHHALPELNAFQTLLRNCCQALGFVECEKTETQTTRKFLSTTYGHSDLFTMQSLSKPRFRTIKSMLDDRERSTERKKILLHIKKPGEPGASMVF